MNYILAKQTPKMPFHTRLGPLIDCFQGLHENYNWLITDFEAFFPPFGDGTRCISKPMMVSGEELTRIATQFPTGQLIWGVLTALPKSMVIDLNHLSCEPLAESGTTFWENKPRLQHPSAIAEIIAWDSSFTILVSTNAALSEAFHKYFPEAEPLEDHNRAYNSKRKQP